MFCMHTLSFRPPSTGAMWLLALLLPLAASAQQVCLWPHADAAGGVWDWQDTWHVEGNDYTGVSVVLNAAGASVVVSAAGSTASEVIMVDGELGVEGNLRVVGGAAGDCDPDDRTPPQPPSGVHTDGWTLTVEPPGDTGTSAVTGYSLLFRAASGAALGPGEEAVDIGLENVAGLTGRHPVDVGYWRLPNNVTLDMERLLRPATEYIVSVSTIGEWGASAPSPWSALWLTPDGDPDWAVPSSDTPWRRAEGAHPDLHVPAALAVEGTSTVVGSWPAASAGTTIGMETYTVRAMPVSNTGCGAGNATVETQVPGDSLLSLLGVDPGATYTLSVTAESALGALSAPSPSINVTADALAPSGVHADVGAVDDRGVWARAPSVDCSGVGRPLGISDYNVYARIGDDEWRVPGNSTVLLDPDTTYDVFLSATVRNGSVSTRRWERWGTIETQPLRTQPRPPTITNITAVTTPPEYGVWVAGFVNPRDVLSRITSVTVMVGAADAIHLAPDADGWFAGLAPAFARAVPDVDGVAVWANAGTTTGQTTLATQPAAPLLPPGQVRDVVATPSTSTVAVTWEAPVFTGGRSTIWTWVNWTTVTDTGDVASGFEFPPSPPTTVDLSGVPVGPDRVVSLAVSAEDSTEPPVWANVALAPPGRPGAPSAVQQLPGTQGRTELVVTLSPETGGSLLSRVCVGGTTCKHVRAGHSQLALGVWRDPAREDPAPVTVVNAAGFVSDPVYVSLNYTTTGAQYAVWPSFRLVGWTPTGVLLEVNDTSGDPGPEAPPFHTPSVYTLTGGATVTGPDPGWRYNLSLPSMDVGTRLAVGGIRPDARAMFVGYSPAISLGERVEGAATGGDAVPGLTITGVAVGPTIDTARLSLAVGDVGVLEADVGALQLFVLSTDPVFVPGLTPAAALPYLDAVRGAPRSSGVFQFGVVTVTVPPDVLFADTDTAFTASVFTVSATLRGVRMPGAQAPPTVPVLIPEQRSRRAIQMRADKPSPFFGGSPLIRLNTRGVNALGRGLETSLGSLTIVPGDSTVMRFTASGLEVGARNVSIAVSLLSAAGLEGAFSDFTVVAMPPPCPVGTFDPSAANASDFSLACTPCPPGTWTFEDTNVAACPACPPGFTGQGCAACPPGSASFGSALECSPCPAGTFQDAFAADTCKQCPGAESGTQYSLSNATACLACPVNTQCPGAVLRVVEGTWWGDAGVPGSTVYACPNPRQCKVSRGAGPAASGFVVIPNATVAAVPACDPVDQFTGLLCAECTHDHVPVNDACVACPPAVVSVLACIAVGVFGVGVTSFMLSRAFAPRNKANKNSTKAAILLRQIVNYLQIMGALSTASIKGPRTFAVVSSLSDVAVALTPDLVPLRCLADASVYALFWVFVALPAVQTVAAAAWLASKHLRKRAPTLPSRGDTQRQVELTIVSDKMKAKAAADRGVARTWSRNGSVADVNPMGDAKMPSHAVDVATENKKRAGDADNKELDTSMSTAWGVAQNVLAAMLVIVTLMYVQLARACLRMYDCYDDEVDGVTPLRSDFRVNCDTTRHRRMRVAALCFGALYLVVVPGAVALLLRRHKRQLYSGGAFQKLWYFVYSPYRKPATTREANLEGGYTTTRSDARYAWDFVVAMQKLALVAVSTTMSNPELQAFAMVLVLSFMITMQAAYRPYASARGNRLALGAYLVALTTQSVVLAQWIMSEDLNPTGTQSQLVTTFLLVLNAGYIAVFFTVAFRMLYVTTKRKLVQRRARGGSSRRRRRRGKRGALPTVVRERKVGDGKDDGSVRDWDMMSNPMREGDILPMGSAVYADSWSQSSSDSADDDSEYDTEDGSGGSATPPEASQPKFLPPTQPPYVSVLCVLCVPCVLTRVVSVCRAGVRRRRRRRSGPRRAASDKNILLVPGGLSSATPERTGSAPPTPRGRLGPSPPTAQRRIGPSPLCRQDTPRAAAVKRVLKDAGVVQPSSLPSPPTSPHAPLRRGMVHADEDADAALVTVGPGMTFYRPATVATQLKDMRDAAMAKKK